MIRILYVLAFSMLLCTLIDLRKAQIAQISKTVLAAKNDRYSKRLFVCTVGSMMENHY